MTMCDFFFPKGKQISFFCFVILFSLSILCLSHLGSLQSFDFTSPMYILRNRQFKSIKEFRLEGISGSYPIQPHSQQGQL